MGGGNVKSQFSLMVICYIANRAQRIVFRKVVEYNQTHTKFKLAIMDYLINRGEMWNKNYS